MAPERVARRLGKLFARCAREARRFDDASGRASRALAKLALVASRWGTLENDACYSAALLEACAGIKSKVLAKQAEVVRLASLALDEAMDDLDDAVRAMRQAAREGAAFVRSEYGADALQRRDGPVVEDRTLSMSAAEYVEGMHEVFTMYSLCLKLKRAACAEARTAAPDDESASRDELIALFDRPPCYDPALARDWFARATPT